MAEAESGEESQLSALRNAVAGVARRLPPTAVKDLPRAAPPAVPGAKVRRARAGTEAAPPGRDPAAEEVLLARLLRGAVAEAPRGALRDAAREISAREGLAVETVAAGGGARHAKAAVAEDLTLHRLCFRGSASAVESFLRESDARAALAARDQHGNTPLRLALLLRRADVAAALVRGGAAAQEAGGGAAGAGLRLLDEAVPCGSRALLALLYRSLQREAWRQWRQERRGLLVGALRGMPDCYVELSWGLSARGPLGKAVARALPSDTYRIWKRGAALRVDYTLKGVKGLNAQRSDLSLLFRELSAADAEEELLLLDHINRRASAPLRALRAPTMGELKAQLNAFVSCGGAVAALDAQLPGGDFAPVRDGAGRPLSEGVRGWRCSVHEAAVTLRAEMRGAEGALRASEESYFHGAEETKAAVMPAPLGAKRSVAKACRARLWLAQDFPLRAKDIAALLDALSLSGAVGTALRAAGAAFPVQAEVPLALGLSARVCVPHVELCAADASFFDVPEDYARGKG